jgi:predicted Zn-dependent protease
MRPAARLVVGIAVLAASACFALSCATNPVTGKKQLDLVGESREIAMGREADKEVAAAYGLYPDERLQQYIQALGTSIASRTERPNLPWTFRVVDDAAVNAFAIPGGFVYVTRGILTHLNSEAELASILGHEIGHVTARHSVSQMSKQQAAQVLLGVGAVASRTVARLGGLLQAGAGLLFLTYSRADESEADRLGLRYMMSGGYDPREMTDVFRMLEGVSSQEGSGGRLPQWLSSHPNPENREAWARQSVAALNRDLSGLTVNRASYIRRLDGIVFGENPREGFFQGGAFRHPDLAFRVQFPRGWKGTNQKQAVGATSPNQDALVVLQLAPGRSAREAAQTFFSQEGVEAGGEWRRSVGGFPAVSADFRAQGDTATIRGLAAWVEYQGRVFQLLGYTTSQQWAQYEQTIADSIGSFARETDSSVLDVQPRRLALVAVPRPATLEVLNRDYPSTVPPRLVGLINDLQAGAALPAGAIFKRVVGGPSW